MQTLNTSLVVNNYIDVKGRAILALIEQYMKFASFHYGFEAEGDTPEIVYPALFVEPKSEAPIIASIGKFDVRITYGIYWHVRGNSRAEVVSLTGWIGSALKKLFSNNALDVMGTENPPQYRYKAYAGAVPNGGWLNSQMLGINYSTTYLNAAAAGVKYQRAGRLMFEVQDTILL